MAVEIYLPLYKADLSLFERAVDSVLKQANSDWRLTVVDDRGGSGDGGDAKTLLARLTGADWESAGNLRYFRNEETLGLRENHNHCLDIASGRTSFSDETAPEDTLIAFLGDDDALEPNYVNVVTQAHRDHPGVSFIHTGVTPIDAEGKPVSALADRMKSFLGGRLTEPTVRGGEELARSLLGGNWMYFQGTAFTAEALKGRKLAEPDFVMDLRLYLDLLTEDHTGLNKHPGCESSVGIRQPEPLESAGLPGRTQRLALGAP